MVWYIESLTYLIELFKYWVSVIFVSPIKTLDMLWLLVPIWLGWFFTEFFQEKKGTGMGNAVTNSVIVLWGGIDAVRQTFRLSAQGLIIGTFNIISRYAIIFFLLLYGVMLIILGLKGKKIIKYIGRIREVTYVFVMFAPIFYNQLQLTLTHIISAVIFFPVFYYLIELLTIIIPNPKAVKIDIEGREEARKNLPEESKFDVFDDKKEEFPEAEKGFEEAKPAETFAKKEETPKYPASYQSQSSKEQNKEPENKKHHKEDVWDFL